MSQARFGEIELPTVNPPKWAVRQRSTPLVAEGIPVKMTGK